MIRRITTPPLLAPFAVLILTWATTPLARANPGETRYPCAFIDTANITGSSYTDSNSTNGSYIYKGMTIPHDLAAIYDFVIENGERMPAEKHLRGCVCKLKPCVRFCCPSGQLYDLQRHICTPIAMVGSELPPSQLSQSRVEILLSNGTLTEVNTTTHFSVHVELPCAHMRTVTKGIEYVHWTLHQNGTVTHHEHLFTKHYCFTPLLISNSSWDLQPLACAPQKHHFSLSILEWTYAICLLISIISMFIVFLVYFLCTGMRNTFYGVAIKVYAICTIIGYSLLAHLTLTDPANFSKTACRLIPAFTLLHLVLSFYILSYISLSLYLGFHGVVLTKLMFWMIFIPIVIIALGWSFFVGFTYHDGKLIFGGTTCWFDPRNWSIMMYLFLPIFIACAISGFFYILTLIAISERRELEGEKSCPPLEENRFKSFWKFFGYTALTYFICVCSFVINYYRGQRSHLNYVVCFFMAFHGFAALYALIGKNQQIQKFLLRIERNGDDDTCENSVPMSSY